MSFVREKDGKSTRILMSVFRAGCVRNPDVRLACFDGFLLSGLRARQHLDLRSVGDWNA
jgi:hypothetical protein